MALERKENQKYEVGDKVFVKTSAGYSDDWIISGKRRKRFDVKNVPTGFVMKNITSETLDMWQLEGLKIEEERRQRDRVIEEDLQRIKRTVRGKGRGVVELKELKLDIPTDAEFLFENGELKDPESLLDENLNTVRATLSKYSENPEFAKLLLGINKESFNVQMVNEIYRKKRIKYHPDKFGNSPLIEEIFKALGTAKETLIKKLKY